MSEMISLNQIDYDPKYYPRAGGAPNWLFVHRYSETLAIDPAYEFDPITLVRATGYPLPYLLIDGLHRTRAYVRVGREAIPANIERLPQSKWLARSVELNVRTHRSLDSQDKAWATTRLKEEGWDIKDVAKLFMMKVESLEKIMVERCVRITAKEAELMPMSASNRKVDGSHFGFLKAALKDTVGTKKSLLALQTQHSVTSHDVEAILDSMICILESGVVDLGKEDVAAKIKVIKRLLRNL